MCACVNQYTSGRTAKSLMDGRLGCSVSHTRTDVPAAFDLPSVCYLPAFD